MEERAALLSPRGSDSKEVNGGGIFAGGKEKGITGGGPDLSSHNNYSTFFAGDPSVQTLLRSSDNIGRTRRTLVESEELAKNVLEDLELQRSQLHDMKGMVFETSTMTGQVRHLLQIIADRSYRKRICLYLIIVALSIIDILIFYLLFAR